MTKVVNWKCCYCNKNNLIITKELKNILFLKCMNCDETQMGIIEHKHL